MIFKVYQPHRLTLSTMVRTVRTTQYTQNIMIIESDVDIGGQMLLLSGHGAFSAKRGGYEMDRDGFYGDTFSG